MKQRMWSFVFSSLILIQGAAMAASDPAADYPNKPVKIIISFPPGQASDLWTRMVAEHLGRRLGQAFVIENRPGAGGQIGVSMGARAAPDGYTLTVGSNGNLSGPAALYGSKLPFDPIKDFTPISSFASVSYLLIASKDYKPSTFQEFIADVKSHPEGLAYGSAGTGTTGHLAMELLAAKTGIKLRHVPYRGAPAAYQDLFGGRLALLTDNMTGATSFITSNKVKVLAVMSPRRSSWVPKAPTIDELGYGPFDASAWAGLLAPAGTPRPIVDKLAQAVAEVMKQKDMIKWMHDQGAEPFVLGPDQFRDLIKSEIVKWTEVVQRAGITPEQ